MSSLGVLLDAQPDTKDILHWILDGLLGIVAFFSIRSIGKLDEVAKDLHQVELAQADLTGKLNLANAEIEHLKQGVAKESTVEKRSDDQDSFLVATLREVKSLRQDFAVLDQRKLSRGEMPAAQRTGDARRDPSDPPDPPPPMRPRAGSIGRPVR